MVVKYKVESGKLIADCYFGTHLVFRGLHKLENHSFYIKIVERSFRQFPPQVYYLFCERFAALCRKLSDIPGTCSLSDLTNLIGGT